MGGGHVNPAFAVVLTVLLGVSMYLAGRLHARVGYRFGYRYGYRQGYYDGDRACWNRVRRGAPGEVELTGLTPVPEPRRPSLRAARPEAGRPLAEVAGTTYTSATAAAAATKAASVMAANAAAPVRFGTERRP
jgi:hypothetical protein